MGPFSASVSYLQGTIDGCIRVEANTTTVLFQIPHDYVPNLQNENDLKKAGIYLLVNTHNRTLYVGQADSRDDGNGILTRMTEWHGKKEISEWNYGYALVSQIPKFLLASELDYLERFFYDEAIKCGNYHLLNGCRPHANEVAYSTHILLMNFTEQVLFLLRYQFHCDIYVPKKTAPTPQKIDNKNFIFENPTKGIYATGIIAEYGKRITVLANSRVCKTSNLSNQKGQESNSKLRQQLMSDGTIINYTFTRDYDFTSTSTAASVILGSAASGPEKWKDKNGVSLKDYLSL